MYGLRLLGLGIVAAPFWIGCSSDAVDLDQIARAMGADEVLSIEFKGTGSSYGYQQAGDPGGPWPRFDVSLYHVMVDYDAPAMRTEVVRSQGERPPRGGAGQPIAGELRTVQLVRAGHAWSEGPSGSIPNPQAVEARSRVLWMTPHGLVKLAQRSGAVPTGGTYRLEIEGQPVTVRVARDGTIDGYGYLIDSPVLGDVPVEVSFLDYAQYGAIRFPRRILETTDGFPTLDITVGEVTVNEVAFPSVPDNVLATVATAIDPSAGVSVQADEIADGVWYINSGNYYSIGIEFADHVVMIEAPLDDARSVAVNEYLRQIVPDKPIRYVVNTHHHFDHAGGLRAYVAEGIPIITHEVNRAFYESAWARPRTLKPDLLSRNPRPAVIETMGDSRVLEDATRRLELYHIRDSGHAPGYVMGYLPAEKLLIYGDSYNPPPGDDPRDLARTNEYAIALYQNIAEVRGLDVEWLVPIHGRVVPFDNLKKAIGMIPVD